MSMHTKMKHIINLIKGNEQLRLSIVKHNISFFDSVESQMLISPNQNVYKNLIAIDGAGFCGSSAVLDYLGEFENCTALGGVCMNENPNRGIENNYEVDFFRDSCGLLSLERICYTKQIRICNQAIQEFINCSVQNYSSNISIYDDIYLKATKEFVDKIVDFSNHISRDEIVYYPKFLSVSEFRAFAKEYLEKCLRNIPSKENLVLDCLMGIAEPNGELLQEYFGDFKVIYIWGDPRDIYARARLCPGNDWVPKDPEIFIKYYLRTLPQYLNSNDPRYLLINFDEFINNYDVTSRKIMDFLGLEEKEHINKFKYFDPKISINNTQVYKKLENQDPINYIYKNLKEYCYEA